MGGGRTTKRIGLSIDFCPDYYNYNNNQEHTSGARTTGVSIRFISLLIIIALVICVGKHKSALPVIRYYGLFSMADASRTTSRHAG